jgi:hypothetical protein
MKVKEIKKGFQLVSNKLRLEIIGQLPAGFGGRE